MILFIFFSSILFGFIFYLVPLFFENNLIIISTKQNPFECGFNNLNLIRISFSLQFFLLGLIFILFDLEILFLLMIFLPNMEKEYIFLFFLFWCFLFFTWWIEWWIQNFKWVL